MISKKTLPCLALLVLALVSTSTLAAAAPNCVQAEAWIADHRASLPGTLDEFLKVPEAYHPFVFNTLSAEVKSALWQAHLERYLAQHPKLSTPQVNLVERALDLASRPSTFSTSKADPLWETLVNQPIQELRQAFGEAFSQQEAAAILGRLAGPDVMRRQILEIDPASGKAVLQCSCSTASDWCSPSPYRCYTTNPSCSSTSSGCGTFFTFACNGTCQNRA
jgi:hypothetical protein